jgi:DNA-directed RNA polymerase specialized sigma24 family protein
MLKMKGKEVLTNLQNSFNGCHLGWLLCAVCVFYSIAILLRAAMSLSVDPAQLTSTELATRCEGWQTDQSREVFCEELFKRILDEDDVVSNEALDYVMGCFRGFVISIVRSRIRGLTESECEELVSDTFHKFWKYFRQNKNAKGLLSMCARAVATDWLRGLRSQNEREADLDESRATEEGSLNSMERMISDREVRQILQQVLRNRRQVVAIFYQYWLGMKTAQIAAARPDLFRNSLAVSEARKVALEKLRKDNRILRLGIGMSRSKQRKNDQINNEDVREDLLE